ncbi:uncharacterized protein KZ484_015549 isoform 1-T2 [Pholidichthys leucotaenia]
MVTPISEESEQLLSYDSAVTEIWNEARSRDVDSESTKEEESKPKKRRLKTRSHSDDGSLTSNILWENKADAPQLHDCKEEEVLTVQQLCNQERNCSLDQEEQDAAQVKEEDEDLCISEEHENFGLKQETDSFTVTPADEGSDSNETEPNSEQRQDHGAGKNVNPGSSKEEEPKKRLNRNRSERNSVHNSMSENRCDTDTGEKSVKCSDNDKNFKNEAQKKKHHTVDTPHFCSTCGKRFQWRSKLSVHERIHTDVLQLQQLWNQEGSSSLDQEEQDAAQVKEEQKEVCTSQEEEHFILKQETDSFMVTLADEDNNSSKTEPNCEQHLSYNSPNTESQDQGAGKNVNPGSSKDEEPKRLRRNRSVSNSVNNSSMSEIQCGTDTGEKSAECSNDKDFQNESHKKKHQTVTKPHVSNTCWKKITRRSNLSFQRIHTGEKPFSCETCGQRFNQHAHLKSHMKSHTGEKPHSCVVCGQRFKYNSCLKRHMRIHTGEKPYSCETCQKSFHQHAHLKTHMKRHTEEKPFSCVACCQRFKYHSCLKRHMRIHTGEKPYSCEICQKSFHQRAHLKSHMKRHTGEKLVSFSLRLASVSPGSRVGVPLHYE